MKVLKRLRRSLSRTVRLYRIYKWRKMKERLAFEAWYNNEYSHSGVNIIAD